MPLCDTLNLQIDSAANKQAERLNALMVQA